MSKYLINRAAKVTASLGLLPTSSPGVAESVTESVLILLMKIYFSAVSRC